jgi:outer membrane protein assembly factor BamB
VTAKAAGHVVVATGTLQAEIEIKENGAAMGLTEPRWILHPLDGQFSRVLWAWETWAGWAEDTGGNEDSHFPAYYYEDRGETASHIRAIRKDGLQAWQWPSGPSSEEPRMVFGDTYGGVLVAVGDSESRVLINLNAKGRERWRVPAPGFGSARTGNLSGKIYYVQDEADKASARIIGLDAHTGQQTLSHELPVSQETIRNLVVRKGKPTCAPGLESVKPLPIFHTKMMTGPKDETYLMYSEASVVADAGQCRAGAAVDLENVRIESTQRLVAVDVDPEGAITSQAVEENSAEGPATTTSLVATLPTGDIIVGDGDTGAGNFVAVRRVISHWGNKVPVKVEEFEYRISANREVLYRSQVPLGSDGAHSVTLLGEDRIGFTSRGKTVIAFDQDTGQEKWRWQGKSGSVLLYAALKDAAVLVQDGEHYFILKNGKAESEREEDFMLFVAKLRYSDDD